MVFLCKILGNGKIGSVNTLTGNHILTLDPETRASLILRLGDRSDDDAWAEFLEIYGPLLLQLATRLGLQRADAEEVVQETLVAVAGAVDQYDRRPHQRAFRRWLAAITRRKLADLLTQRRRGVSASGGSNAQHWFDQQAEQSADVSRWDWCEKQEIFRWAAARVRQQVSSHIWEAFHRTSVMGESIASVAAALEMREGMVYVARSRVMTRLRETVAVWENAEMEKRSSVPQGDDP